MGRNCLILLVVFVCVYVVGWAWSWGACQWLIPNENFPLETRSIRLSIQASMSFLFSFVIIDSFLSMLCSFNWGFMFFFAWNFVMIFFVFFYIFETKWMPFQEIISRYGGDIGFGKNSCQSIIILLDLKQNPFDNTNMLWTPFGLHPSCPWSPNWTWRNTNIKLCLEILQSNLPSYFMNN